MFIYNHMFPVLEADIVADLAGGSGAGLGQEEPPVGANANLVDSLPGPGGRGAGGGLPLGQPHQTDPPSVQRDLGQRERKWVRLGKLVTSQCFTLNCSFYTQNTCRKRSYGAVAV